MKSKALRIVRELIATCQFNEEETTLIDLDDLELIRDELIELIIGSDEQ